MCTNETAKCPHCERPCIAHLTPGLAVPRPCGACRQTYLEEVADTLFAVLTSRLENRSRSRCTIVEPEHEDVPSGTLFRRILRVESLPHDNGSIAEANFDYDFKQLRISPRAQTKTKHVPIEALHFLLDDIQLNTIARNFLRALELVGDANDEEVAEDVRFREQVGNIQLSFQQPCQHIPPCPSS